MMARMPELVAAAVADVEAEQAVDLVLIEDPGDVRRRLGLDVGCPRLVVGAERLLPLGREGGFVGRHVVFGVGHEPALLRVPLFERSVR